MFKSTKKLRPIFNSSKMLASNELKLEVSGKINFDFTKIYREQEKLQLK